MSMKSAARRLARGLGLAHEPPPPPPPPPPVPELSEFDLETLRLVQPYTMTSPQRVSAVIKSVHYLSRHKIEGDIVECGVWKGGSMMAAARTLLSEKSSDRRLYLYDTFDGMSAPTSADKDLKGVQAESLLRTEDRATSHIWAYAPIDEVRKAISLAGYDERLVTFVQGKVEDTIPGTIPDRIALLRLDTDWYESTRHELVHLFPRLVRGGVMIIDDYGHWLGARKAVDEYLSENNIRMLLNVSDYTGRIGVKLD
jgi:hypothetical protein